MTLPQDIAKLVPKTHLMTEYDLWLNFMNTSTVGMWFFPTGYCQAGPKDIFNDRVWPLIKLYEYFNCRHVILPQDIAKLVPKTHLMTESEWRNLGVQQSPGWIHYMMHAPEPHILLFRRPVPTKQGWNHQPFQNITWDTDSVMDNDACTRATHTSL